MTCLAALYVVLFGEVLCFIDNAGVTLLFEAHFHSVGKAR